MTQPAATPTSPPAPLPGLVICDLDRTLFDSDLQLSDLTHAIAFLPQRPGVALNAAALQSAGSTTELFDTFAHLQAAGYTAAEIAAALAQAAPHRDYLFADVAPALQQLSSRNQTDVAIITTGGDAGQQFKQSLSPALTGLPLQVIQTDKGSLLEGCFQADGTVQYNGRSYAWLTLLEDKAATFTAFTSRPNLHLIQVLRPNAKYPEPSNRGDVTVVHNLMEALPHIPTVTTTA